MKQTRKLILVLLAAGVVLTLSSCNAMLDAIYPERQIINVEVRMTGVYPTTINVQLLDGSGNSLESVTSNTGVFDGTYTDYNFQFTKLKNATYGLYTYNYFNATYTYGFYDPSGYGTTSIPVPYYQSSDITNLTVYNP